MTVDTEICINICYRSFFANRMRHKSLRYPPNSTHTNGARFIGILQISNFLAKHFEMVQDVL